MSDTFFVGYAYDTEAGRDVNNRIVIKTEEIICIDRVTVLPGIKPDVDMIYFGIGTKSQDRLINVYFESIEAAHKEHNRLCDKVLANTVSETPTEQQS